MSNLIKSRIMAWAALVLVIAMLCVTFRMRVAWWAYIDIFFAFMMAFVHLMAVYLGRKLPAIGRQLDMMAFILACLAVIAFIAEYFAFR